MFYNNFLKYGTFKKFQGEREWSDMAVTLTLPKCPQPMILLNATGLKNKTMFII